MQSQTNPNDTKLPRAILKRSAAINARYAKTDESEIPAAGAAAPATEPASNPATPAEPAAPAVVVDPRENDPAYWKQRFSVTSGLLARERDDNSTALRGLRQRVSELQGQLEVAQASRPAGEPVAVDVKKFFTDAQIEQYGPEQCETMARAAMTAAHETAKTLVDAAVRPFKEEQQTREEDDKARVMREFKDKLFELVPDWQEIDKDQRWLDWLADDDENGVSRQGVLTEHIERQNAARAAKMFLAWKKSVAPAPAAPAAPAQPPITPSGTGAGGGEGPANAAAVPGAGRPTATEIKDFYKRAALGKVKPEERVAFEARLGSRNPA
jgi:hypothetical protein